VGAAPCEMRPRDRDENSTFGIGNRRAVGRYLRTSVPYVLDDQLMEPLSAGLLSDFFP
jgi:hypothetical protein